MDVKHTPRHRTPIVMTDPLVVVKQSLATKEKPFSC